MDAISLTDMYQPYITSQVGGGVQGMESIGGEAAAYGTGMAQASSGGIVWTWGVIATLVAVAYIILR